MTISENDDDSFTNSYDDRRLSLIDVSSADDSLISNPIHYQHSSELFCTSNLRDEFDDAATKLKEWEREPQPNEIQNNKFNLRQSIAWDTAFFTSPGVLDPEELSSMMGVEKGDKHAPSLPAIQEDVHGSCESVFTSKSNNSLTQESLEDVDFFQDVRASIQNFGRMSDLARTNKNVPSRFQNGGSSKEVGMTSCKKAPSSKSPRAGMQGTGKLTKNNPISPQLSQFKEGVEMGDKHALPLPAIQVDVHGSCESISTFKSNNSMTQESLEDDLFQDVRASIQNFGTMSDFARANKNVPSRFQTGGSSKEVGMASSKKATSSKSPSASMQGTAKLTKKNPISAHLSRKPVARREEPCISKQRKTLGKSSPSSTISSNRTSLGDLHVKSEKDKTNKQNCGKVNSVMNTTVIKGSQVNGLQPITLSKSPLGLSTATKTKSTISPSSSSNLSSSISKSPLNSLKRKVDAGTKKSPSSCSIVKTPPRIPSRDKIGSSNSSLSGLVSATKFSSSISPANSISDWSSESSSSTSMTKFRSNSSRTTFHSSSSRKHIPKKDAPHVSNSQKSQSGSCLEGKETGNAGSISQCVRAAAAGIVPTPSPKKPLGLRQPSPKIGFFERVKPSVRSPCERMQPHTIAPQGRASPSECQNKARRGKLQSPRSITSTENKEFINQQALNSVPCNKSSDVKTSMALPHVESSTVAPMEVQNQMHLKAGVGNLDANSTMVEGHIRSAHDLNLGFTQGNSQYDDQVDCLSRQVELMDINLKTQT